MPCEEGPGHSFGITFCQTMCSVQSLPSSYHLSATLVFWLIPAAFSLHLHQLSIGSNRGFLVRGLIRTTFSDCGFNHAAVRDIHCSYQRIGITNTRDVIARLRSLLRLHFTKREALVPFCRTFAANASAERSKSGEGLIARFLRKS